MSVMLSIKNKSDVEVEVTITEIKIGDINSLVSQVRGQLMPGAKAPIAPQLKTAAEASSATALRPPAVVSAPATQSKQAPTIGKPIDSRVAANLVVDKTGLRGRHPATCICAKCQIRKGASPSIENVVIENEKPAPKPITVQAAKPAPAPVKPVAPPKPPAAEEPVALADDKEWDALQEEVTKQMAAAENQTAPEETVSEPAEEETVSEESEETVSEETTATEETIASEEEVGETQEDLPACLGKHNHPLDTVAWAQKTESGKLKRLSTCEACPHEEQCMETSDEVEE